MILHSFSLIENILIQDLTVEAGQNGQVENCVYFFIPFLLTLYFLLQRPTVFFTGKQEISCVFRHGKSPFVVFSVFSSF